MSNLGRVKTYSYRAGARIKATGIVSRRGRLYRQCGLDFNGRRTTRMVHQLVAQAFLPNPQLMPLVQHLDDDGLNNCLENLAWGDHRSNALDSVRNGTNTHANTTHCPQGHEYTDENTYRRKDRTGRNCRACALDRNRK